MNAAQRRGPLSELASVSQQVRSSREPQSSAQSSREPQSSAQSPASDAAASQTSEAQAEHNYLKGLEILKKAEQAGFHDTRVLYQAYRHLLVALRKNASDPRYPCGVAYVLILIDQNERAKGYLDLALSLVPDYARALQLKEVLNKLKANPDGEIKKYRWKIFAELPTPRSDDDFDDLYEAVEDFIEQETHAFMQSQFSLALSLDAGQMQKQQLLLGELRQFLYLVHQKLSVLDQEIEIQDLERSLEPVQKILKRLQNTLSQASEMRFLQQDIQLAYADVAECAHKMKQDPEANANALNLRLERFYDICDVLADELDDLSKQGPITLLEADYNRLIQEVQVLQELIDDV